MTTDPPSFHEYTPEPGYTLPAYMVGSTAEQERTAAEQHRIEVALAEWMRIGRTAKKLEAMGVPSVVLADLFRMAEEEA